MTSLLFDMKRVGGLIWQLGKHFALPLIRRLLTIPPAGPATGARLRQVFEEMGITYVKLGQFLAMRFDILPPEICRELARLFENVPPMEFESVCARIEQELGAPPEKLFAYFERQCIASASIAQVHKARTMDGLVVAVKVQRWQIRSIFAADIRNLRRLARAVDALRIIGRLSLLEAVDEFAAYTAREMDFLTEGRTAERLRYNAGKNEYIPFILWPLSTSRVLTMEYIEGVSLATISTLLERGEEARIHECLPGIDLPAAIEHLVYASLRQLFVTGFFHADPHPGNIMFRRDGMVVFLDFGIFGELTQEERYVLAKYIEKLSVGDVEASYDYYSRLSTPTADTDVQAFEREVKKLLSEWYTASRDPTSPLEKRHVGRFAGDMIAVLRRHRMKMSLQTLLFWRALIALDSTALRVTAHLDLLEVMRNFFRDMRGTSLLRTPAITTEWLHRLPSFLTHGRQVVGKLAIRAKDDDVTLHVRREQDATRKRRELALTVWLAATLVLVGLVIIAKPTKWINRTPDAAVAPQHSLPTSDTGTS